MPTERENNFIPRMETIDGVLVRLAESNPDRNLPPENETPEERAIRLGEKKARLAEILTRGVVNDMLTVNLPPEYKGEWVRADAMQVRAMQSMGFWLDNEFADKRVIHGDGTSGNRVGDVVFMVTSAENYDIIQQIKREQAAANEYKGLRAEVEFQNATKRATGGDIPTFVDSKVKQGNITVLPTSEKG
jgi:hypothetical protein